MYYSGPKKLRGVQKTLLDKIVKKDFTGVINEITNFRYQSKKGRFTASNNYFDRVEIDRKANNDRIIARLRNGSDRRNA